MTSTLWRTMKLGGGGFLTGIEIANDGTKVVRADVYGAYVNTLGNTTWRQMVTTAALPAGTAPGQGPFEVTISKSNSSIIYMLLEGYLYKSTDQGVTFLKLTAFNGGVAIPVGSSGGNRTGQTGLGFANRMMGRFMAVDPNDPNVLYVTTPESGCFYTFDGGSSFTQIGTVTQSSAVGGYMIPCVVAIDQHATPVNGRSPNVYIGSYGLRLYKTTNGGASTPTWSQEAGGPTTYSHMAVDNDGTLYVADNSQFATYGQTTGTVWTRTTGGTWTDLALTEVHSVAPDPGTAGRVVFATDGGNLSISTNHGTSVTALGTASQVATDVPWLALTPNGYMSNGDMAFDQNAVLWFAEGIGVYSTTPPSSGPYTWTSQTAGIEELVVNFICSSPSYSYPLVGCWDRPLFKIANPDTFPATQQPNNIRAIQMGWNGDYVSSDTTKVVAVVNSNFGAYVDDSGISADGGTTWTAFGTVPNYPILTTNATTANGNAVLHFASVPTNLITTSPGGGSASSGSRQVTYLGTLATTTASTTSPSRILHFGGGLPANVAIGMTAIGNGMIGVSVVAVNNAGVTGDVLLDGPPFAVISSGQQISFRQGGLSIDPNAFISAVTSTTITMGTAASGASVLSGESFAISAGVGGCIAASTPLNMVWVSENQEPYPWYTKDGGATWQNVIIGTSITGFDGNGAAIPDPADGNATGWGSAYYDSRICVAADRVTANKFYLYNCRGSSTGGGLYVSTNSGDTWTKKFTGQIAGDNGGFGARLMAVPGNAGHLFMSGCNASFRNNGISRSFDSGATWTALANVSNVQSFGLGAPKPGGNGYPALYFAGQVSAVSGIWRSDDLPTVTEDGSETWTKVGEIYPTGWLNGVSFIEADQSVYGRVYAGMAQAGCLYGALDGRRGGLRIGIHG